jgi:hypothetical protein
MKRLVVLIMLLYAISIFAQYGDISWNSPQLTSNNSFSFLEKNLDESNLFSLKNIRVLRDSSTINFALFSWQDFKHSVSNFFSQDDNSYFLYYRSPDRQPNRLDPRSSSMSFHPNNIPLRSLLRFSLHTGSDFAVKGDNNYYFVFYGTKLSGYINRRLFFYGYWWAGHFAGDTDYADSTSALIDSWTQSSSDNDQIHLDNITGKITYIGKGNFWSASIGRGKYEIGSNIGGSIILNNDCNDYGYFSNKFIFKELYISFLHATLIPDSTSYLEDKKYTDKFLVIHKIGWTPNNKFELFLGEEVIYGNRNIEVSYLLPITFWRATEHNIADRDNVLIFAGMNWKPINNNLIYSNFILDELRKSEIFGDWWGNKYALQMGNSYTFDQQRNLKLSLEFTAIRPWLYTHYILHNKFSHDRIGLGFPEGSNLIQFATEFNIDLRQNLNFNLHSAFTRQGSVGNSFSINYESRDKSKDNDTHWLEGEITNKLSLCPVITWQPLAHHHLKIGLSSTQTEEEDMENEIFISYQAIY